MAILAVQTVVGNVGRVYDLRTVGAKNTPVVDFSVAVTPRKQVEPGQWEDGETYWINVTAWNKLAENVVESFKSGDRVFVHGRMDMKPGYENREGKQIEARPIMTADFAGHEVSYNAAESKRVAGGNRNSNGNASRSNGPAPRREPAPKVAAPVEDDLFSDDGFDFDDDGEPPF